MKKKTGSFTLARMYKNIKELIATSKEDRNLALDVFHTAKAQLENAEVNPLEKDSIRRLMVETLKLAQSSKASSIKAIELFIKHQELSFEGNADGAGEAVNEGFLGDG